MGSLSRGVCFMVAGEGFSWLAVRGARFVVIEIGWLSSSIGGEGVGQLLLFLLYACSALFFLFLLSFLIHNYCEKSNSKTQ